MTPGAPPGVGPAPPAASLADARKPWVLVDAVVDLEPARIRCRKHVSASDFFLIGHFSEHSIYPGVMLATAMAQAAEILARRGALVEWGASLRVSAVDVHLLAPVVPDDTLLIEVAHLGALAFRGEIRRGDAVVVRGTVTLAGDQRTPSDPPDRRLA